MMSSPKRNTSIIRWAGRVVVLIFGAVVVLSASPSCGGSTTTPLSSNDAGASSSSSSGTSGASSSGASSSGSSGTSSSGGSSGTTTKDAGGGDFTSCKEAKDCAWGEIDHEILSKTDCICLFGCPHLPLNEKTVKRRMEQYKKLCDSNKDGQGNLCPIDDCAGPGPIVCRDNVCSAPKPGEVVDAGDK